MPNSKPKKSYLLHAKISSDKASNQPTTKCSLTNILYKKIFLFHTTKIFHKCYNTAFESLKREH